MKGKDLEFISLILKDGSRLVPVGTPWNPDLNIPKTETVGYMDEDYFTLHPLSLSQGTYIAHGFNSWIVKIKK